MGMHMGAEGIDLGVVGVGVRARRSVQRMCMHGCLTSTCPCVARQQALTAVLSVDTYGPASAAAFAATVEPPFPSVQQQAQQQAERLSLRVRRTSYFVPSVMPMLVP